MNWKKLVEDLKATLPFIKSGLSSFLLKSAGIAGGFWGWVVTFFIGKAIEEAVEELEHQASLADQGNIDEKNIEEHQQDMKENAPVEQKIENETDLLNGKKP